VMAPSEEPRGLRSAEFRAPATGDLGGTAELWACGFAGETGNRVLWPDPAARYRLSVVATTGTLREAGLPGTGHSAVVEDQPAAIAIWLETTDPIDPPIHARFGSATVAHLDDAARLPGLRVTRREPSNQEHSA